MGKGGSVMRMQFVLTVVVLAGFGVVACDRSSPTSAPNPTAEKLKKDVQEVGQDLRAVGQQAATQVKPKLEEARERAREAVNAAANRVAQETATRPATGPQ